MLPTDQQKPQEPINPYEVSAALGDLASGPDVQPAPEQPCFQIEMDWADRRRFLKAVGPLRVAAVLGAVSLVVNWPNLTSLHVVFVPHQHYELPPVLFIGTVISLVRGGLWGYACWLQWQLADALATTAGGREASMRRWSEIQLRASKIAVAVMGIGILSGVWMSIVLFVVQRSLGK